MAGQFSRSAVAGELLGVAGVGKTFGGTVALRDVSLAVHGGEILALLGENGAGKSTLIKIIAGIHQADKGKLSFRGETMNADSLSKKIAFIHQDLGLIPWMTVAENIMLGTDYPRRFGLIDWQAGRRRALAALGRISGEIDPDDRVERLSRTDKSLVAIARALSRDAELIILDEPTASLPQSEVERLHDVLRTLRGQGVGMIYVSHRLDEVHALCDRVVVLRDGIVVLSATVADTTSDQLVHAIIGRPHDQIFVRAEAPETSDTVLEVSDLLGDGVGPVTLSLRPGEVVGLVGLRGAGQDGVGRILFGVDRPRAGQMRLGGEAYLAANPADAIAKGVLMVAGDRNGESIGTGMSIQENIFLNPVASGTGYLRVRRPGDEAAEAATLGARVRLRPNVPEAPIETLSGGNQQKVVMARWMRIGGKVLILEDPTAGVDVGAKAEIYRLLSDALAEQLAVLLVSTDFEEVAAICHRAYVFSAGRIVEEIGAKDLTVGRLLGAASLSPAA